jgi:hypothetical protein
VNNAKKEPLYKIRSSSRVSDIFVTGEHFVLDKTNNKWVQVKNYAKAEIQPSFIPDYFSCLITTDGRIRIEDEIFWDWEDDELTTR